VDGYEDILPIDECACYNEDGSFNASQFEAFLGREIDESSARMRVPSFCWNCCQKPEPRQPWISEQKQNRHKKT
jgi:hypothetical protein